MKGLYIRKGGESKKRWGFHSNSCRTLWKRTKKNFVNKKRRRISSVELYIKGWGESPTKELYINRAAGSFHRTSHNRDRGESILRILMEKKRRGFHSNS